MFLSLVTEDGPGVSLVRAEFQAPGGKKLPDLEADLSVRVGILDRPFSQGGNAVPGLSCVFLFPDSEESGPEGTQLPVYKRGNRGMSRWGCQLLAVFLGHHRGSKARPVSRQDPVSRQARKPKWAQTILITARENPVKLQH